MSYRFSSGSWVRMWSVLACTSLLWSALASTAAAVPMGFNVQGRLTDENGVNRTGTGYSIRFTIWDKLEGVEPAATKLWEAQIDGITVRNGNFQVVLGAEGQPSLEGKFAGDAAFLEMTVVAGPDVAAEEDPLTPRMQLVSVPYAMRASVADTVRISAMPPGTVLPYAAETAPAGFLECSGAAISRSDFANLFAVIGTTFGEGDGITTFNLPDMQGAFVRGWNHGQGKDPDALTRTALSPGGRTGDRVGSYQGDELKSHSHTVPFSPTTKWNQCCNPQNDAVSGQSQSGATGGDETRPRNVYLMYIIKT